MTLDQLRERAKQVAEGQPVETEPEATAEEALAVVVDQAEVDTWHGWLTGYNRYWGELLPDGISDAAFTMSALGAVHNSEDLQKIAHRNPISLITSLAMCAHFGLMPDGVQAAIVPFLGQASFIPMYQGYIDLMYGSGVVETVVFDHIRRGDTYKYDGGRRPPKDFSHKKNLLAVGEDREELIAYAYAWMGEKKRSQVVFLTREEAENIMRDHSKSWQNAENNRSNHEADFAANPKKGKYNSPWHTHFLAMWLKSVVKQLAKRVPTNPMLRQLIRADFADSTTVERIDVPVEVSRFLTGKVERGEKPRGGHEYVYDENRDPFCAHPGCGQRDDDDIHLI